MLSKPWMGALVLTVCVVAGSARASGELEVVFDLSGSQTTAGGVVLDAVTAGSASVTVEADGPVTPLPGTATLSGVSISMEIFADVLEQVLGLPGLLVLTGPLSIEQQAPAVGVLSADLSGITFDPGVVNFDIVGTIDCQGSLCSIIGVTPIVIETSFTNAAPQTFGVSGLDQPSGAMLLGNGNFFVNPFIGMATVAIMGSELTRAFDPGDTDGDGLPDDADRCVDSILDPTVVIDSCDSGVANVVDGEGCSITDRVLECAQGGNHGSFVSCVARLKRTLGLEGSDNGAIQSCAARSAF